MNLQVIFYATGNKDNLVEIYDVVHEEFAKMIGQEFQVNLGDRFSLIFQDEEVKVRVIELEVHSHSLPPKKDGTVVHVIPAELNIYAYK